MYCSTPKTDLKQHLDNQSPMIPILDDKRNPKVFWLSCVGSNQKIAL